MEQKDFFVSYNKNDKEWAKWIAGTLEEAGYSVYIQAWDITPGQDFIERMNDFLTYSKRYIAVYSDSFAQSEYCMKELQTAFNAHLQHSIEQFLPVRVENASLGPLYNTTVYIDLFPLSEEKAASTLLNGIGHTPNPRKKGAYPGACAAEDEKRKFPGIGKNEELVYRNILIFGKGKAQKEERFSRLIGDVFHTLGFDETDAQPTGQSVNMSLKHRTENRVALIKYKLQKEPVSASDLNQFVGALDMERQPYEARGTRTVGYFVSKSGFRDAALEQERQRSARAADAGTRLVLLGQKELVRELVCGNVLCSPERAIDAVQKKEELRLCRNVDLIVSEFGWVWALYYSANPAQQATHFALIHADGNPLLPNLARDILSTEEGASYFSDLIYLSPNGKRSLHQEAAKQAYFQYLEKELGEIQFDGMPTDKEAGAVKVQLESIFVPLSFYDIETETRSIHEVLASERAAILAKPGGGKSTLIRRIALAYAYPDRRQRVNDGLPDEDRFPIYVRCRDLGEEAGNAILEIISSIVRRAEIRQYKEAFDALVEDALQNGTVLLLIDGLDEIANETYRIRFVNQLRTFLATYPTARLLITSREAGFRAVADTLAGYCTQYSIANLGANEIRTLSLKWHHAILQNEKQAALESGKVCDTILNDPRILSLAENPLLLTTLLFVKRWVGYLPTKKCHLYEEMIKLLLVTWNAVAHEKLDIDETTPQLAYIAYRMTLRGKQKITKETLAVYIREARKELPDLLGYTTVSPERFITQVEERSSLLIQLGLEENDAGRLVPSYEFSHLSFQEYLTAKAIANGWFPDSDSVSPSELVREHLSEEHWIEIIPMVAVLAGRRQAKEIVEHLLASSSSVKKAPKTVWLEADSSECDNTAFLLANCLACEVPMSADLLEQSIHRIIREKRNIDVIVRAKAGITARGKVFSIILNSKYGYRYREIAEESLHTELEPCYVYEYCDAWNKSHADDTQSLSNIAAYFRSEDPVEHVKGSLLMMHWTFRQPRPNPRNRGKSANQSEELSVIFEGVGNLLLRKDELSLLAATWCIAWAGYNERDLIPYPLYKQVFSRLLDIWTLDSESAELNRFCSWAMKNILHPEWTVTVSDGQAILLKDTVERKYNAPHNEFDALSALGIALITRLWTPKELNDNAYALKNQGAARFIDSRFLKTIIAHIRPDGSNAAAQ